MAEAHVEQYDVQAYCGCLASLVHSAAKELGKSHGHTDHSQLEEIDRIERVLLGKAQACMQQSLELEYEISNLSGNT